MLYNDAEYRRVISALKNDSIQIEQDGYPVIIKTAPDAIPGGMDPRAKKLLHILSADPGPEKIDLSDMAAIRSCMCWKSLDITTELINVNHSSFIAGAGDRIPLRIYSLADAVKPGACIIYFHGGGWIGGAMSYMENLCKLMCERAQATVIAVDYRVAPEHPFPAPFEDCCDAVSYIYNNAERFNIKQNSIAVAGDSAGSNLAAACALWDRDNNTHMIAFQALLYPCVNPLRLPNKYYTWSQDFYEVLADEDTVVDLCINELPVKRGIDIVEEAYLPDPAYHSNPYALPLLAKDYVDVAPAVIVTPEYDPLRIEGEAYAKRMAGDGVNVSVVRYRGINHGFAEKIGQYPQAEDCADEVAKAFNSALKSRKNK